MPGGLLRRAEMNTAERTQAASEMRGLERVSGRVAAVTRPAARPSDQSDSRRTSRRAFSS
jgi:hypothetical protein